MDNRNLYSIEAEASVLGSSLMSQDAYRRAAEILQPGDFYNATHAEYWAVFAKLDERGQEFDTITVAEYLHAQGMDCFAHLTQIVKNTSGTGSIMSHAKIIKAHAKDRRMVAACQTAIERVLAGDVDGVDEAQAAIMAVGEESQGNEPVLIADALKNHVDVLEMRNQGKAKGLSTSFVDFDKMTGGLRGGQVIVIAARPKMGKTTFSINIAENVAAQKMPTLVFSLEMGQQELSDRIIASQAKIEVRKLISGELEEDEWMRVGPAFAKMQDWPLWLDDSVSITINDIRAKARRVKAKSGLGMIVIDYLGLMDGKGENQNLKISEITRGTKKLAKELNVPVILLSQLNRDLEKRNDKVPQLSDLRDSGAIEQDADMVVFLYDDSVYNPGSQYAGLTMVKIAAQRSGPTGCFWLTKRLQYSRFENCDIDHGEFEASGITGRKGYDDFG